MKKQIIILLVISFFYSASAQLVLDVVWQKNLGGSGDESAQTICKTNDGEYFILGSSDSDDGQVVGSHGGVDFWVIKIDENGIFAQIPFGGSGYDQGQDVKQTSDGGFILVGGSNSNDGQVSGNHGNNDVWVVRLDAAGHIDWQKSLGGSSSEVAFAVEITSDGGFLIGAATESTDGDVSSNHGLSDVWLIKLDAFGSIVWEKTYGGSDFDICYSLLGTEDGGYIMAGSTFSNDGDVSGNHGSNDSWVLKIDADGNIEWQNSLGGSQFDEAMDIIESSDGYYYAFGYSASEDGDISEQNGFFDFWLVKLTDTGELVWSHCYGGSNYEYGYALVEYMGNIVIAGSTCSSDGDVSLNIGICDFWVVAVNPSGEIVWEKSLGGTEYDKAFDIVTKDLDLFVAGYSESSDGDVTENFGGKDYWLARLEWIESVNEEDNFKVQVFPNPVGEGKLHIQSKSNTHFELISVTGSILISKDLEASSQTIDVSYLSNGIYLARFVSEQGSYLEKILIE